MVRILLVDDNEMNRDMLSRRLARRGYEVQFAPDAEHALAMLASLRPDLVLMDAGLPGLDGWEATRQLKQNPATAEIPAIALTPHALAADREKAQEVGCDEQESKPIDFPTLLMRIEALLEQRG